MKLINNDCIVAMKEMPENSVDAIVTDPPYGLEFMGKEWDAPWKNAEVVSTTSKSANGIFHDKGFDSGIRYSRGHTEMREFQKWCELWAIEALRVLKPGGHLLAFSGSRTYHRMTCAIEDAGFEIRDQIMWVYGSGFPKSHNVSKAIDKEAGAEREVIRVLPSSRAKASDSGFMMAEKLETAPSTDAAKQWQGWGTALKPAHEPIVLARKPLIGTVANNVLTFGTGGLNIDGTRVAHLSEADRASATPQGKVTSNKMAGSAPDVENEGRVDVERPDTSLGRFPANFIHDGSDEVVELFPSNNKPSGIASGATRGKLGTQGRFGSATGENMGESAFYGDTGSAARFFYCAKTSKRDRNEGLDGFKEKNNRKMMGNANNTAETASVGFERFQGTPSANNHPTVKPTALMQYLVRLITPPNGIVLDPFMGSGSTGKACAYEGFDFIGIDQSAEYVEIARARIEFALQEENTKEDEKEYELPF
jgi:DNA modification methylase